MQGDCLELMEGIPDKSVDLILCDLPYGTTACKWDSVIPFDKIWEQYNRIIKDCSSIVLFGSEPFASNLRMSNIDYYKYDWIWHKQQGTGILHSHNMPMKDYENICVFSKGKIGHEGKIKNRMIYHPQGVQACDKIQNMVLLVWKAHKKENHRKTRYEYLKKISQEAFCFSQEIALNYIRHKSLLLCLNISSRPIQTKETWFLTIVWVAVQLAWQQRTLTEIL